MDSLSQMKLLINMARIDGNVGEREKNYIINIGRANGIYPDQINSLLNQTHDLIIPKSMTADQRFDYLLSVVQLMKIDERMYKEEIVFCSQIANKLGYDKQVMFELMLNVKPGDMSNDEKSNLKKITEKYLKN
jgi:uncharacterized tellurite resistance protein B-like protein